MTEFYDSAQPDLIPAHARACLYYDGDYAAKAAEARRFSATRWITVFGDYRNCGIADYEPGNPVYGNEGALREWAAGRQAMNCRARVYCDLANLDRARSAVKGLGNVVWWVATLNGNKLSATFIPDLWAVQFAGGPDADYDTSLLYGTW